ncbi:hypothetical protein BHE74_00003774 [Ensete ventricosum]|nr:hypothetical protein BHE74_00003774 [Ensete ventricosum]
MPKVSGGKLSQHIQLHQLKRLAKLHRPKLRGHHQRGRPTFRSHPMTLPEDKKVKILSRRHKSRHGEGGSRSHSKGKEPAVSVEEPEGQAKSPDEVGTSVFVRPKSIKDLCGTKVCKDDVGYYALYMSDLAQHDLDKEMRARWDKLRNSPKVWSDYAAAEEFERGLLHSQLARELYTLPSEVLLARAAKEMVPRVAELEKELERTQQERTEALQRLEVSDKDLNEVQGDLSKARKQLKEVRVRARKADDDLLKSMKDLEGAQAELPMQAINDYKGSAGFKEGRDSRAIVGWTLPRRAFGLGVSGRPPREGASEKRSAEASPIEPSIDGAVPRSRPPNPSGCRFVLGEGSRFLEMDDFADPTLPFFGDRHRDQTDGRSGDP